MLEALTSEVGEVVSERRVLADDSERPDVDHLLDLGRVGERSLRVAISCLDALLYIDEHPIAGREGDVDAPLVDARGGAGATPDEAFARELVHAGHDLSLVENDVTHLRGSVSRKRFKDIIDRVPGSDAKDELEC